MLRVTHIIRIFKLLLMRQLIICIVSCLLAIHGMAQKDRGFKLVKQPTENPTNQKRKAVVIGMSDYIGNSRLDNTLNDARDIATVFTQLGFEVTLLENNDLRNFKTNLGAWFRNIEANDMAVLYYAGHGIEVNGINYLIPVDADIASEADVEYNTLNVNWLLSSFDYAKVGMKLLILDACRNNPFKRSWSRGTENSGLAQLAAPKGTYIAFAASPGFTAEDGGKYNLRNGVFTHYLKQEILKEGASINEIFDNVTGGVAGLTRDQQIPFKNSSLGRNFYFRPARKSPGSDNPKPVTETVTKFYYYIDQNSNESTTHFTSRADASAEMKQKKLYGKIYSNAGEVFVVDPPSSPVNPSPSVPVSDPTKNITLIKQKLTDAKNYYDKSEYSKAAAIFATIDPQDMDADAMRSYGWMYYEGNGVTKDFAQARYWFMKAVDNGDISSMRPIGLMYRDGEGVPQDYVQARNWFQRGADKGNPFAMNSLAMLYDGGKGVAQDDAKAAYWFRKAADGGSASGAYNLALMYENGQGMPVDLVQAKYWFQKAADRGDKDAQAKLAKWNNSPSSPTTNTGSSSVQQKLADADKAYIAGEYNKAASIYTTMQSQDFDVEATRNLAWMYYEGKGYSKDFIKAKSWAQQAADNGNVSCMRLLGLMYRDASGVTQDYVQARYWFQKASDNGNVSAMVSLALLYDGGKGVPQDYPKAAYWFRKAADGGSSAAAYNLAIMYENGQGMAVDYVQAKYWYQKAADRGDTDAKAKLANWKY